jgi:hypothetical protein
MGCRDDTYVIVRFDYVENAVWETRDMRSANLIAGRLVCTRVC